MTKAKTIIQTGIGLEIETLLRCDRLRACLGRSRSYVIERALTMPALGVDGGLAALERERAGTVGIFNALAEAAGMTWQEYASAYVDAFGLKTYPPDVEALAAMKFTGRESAEQIKRKLTRLAGQRRSAAREAAEAQRESEAQELVPKDLGPWPAVATEIDEPKGTPDEVPVHPPRPLSLRDLQGS